MGEPIKPARLAHMLMKPIATAAADWVSVSVGNTQKGEPQKKAAIPVRLSQNITSRNGWPGMALAARQTAVAV